jgi:CRISPR-associated endonuclease/helicase Cas3
VLGREPSDPLDQAALMLAQVEEDDLDPDSLCRALKLDAKMCKVKRYPDGRGAIVYDQSSSDNQGEPDPYALDDLELLDGTGEPACLDQHSQAVLQYTQNLVAHCVDSQFAAAFKVAASAHDWGKADPRFQQCLNNGARFGPPDLLAKSKVAISQSRWQFLARLTRLPERFRHEMLSAQLAEMTLIDSPDRDLILHLIAAHHGRGRPFAPLSMDDQSTDVSTPIPKNSVTLTAARRMEKPAHRLDSGIAERFWSLTSRYGWWGLAYLEAILRLADQHASRLGENR